MEKPKLLQEDSSTLVMTDPKGKISDTLIPYLQKKGYKIESVDLTSAKYGVFNPNNIKVN